MKVIQSIEQVYEEQKELNQILKSRVDEIFVRIKNHTWHYLSRIKQIESFALKIETGRISNPKQLEDFFACTLVVENLDQINKAIGLIRNQFNFKYQRPQNPKLTHKESFSFPFDDLRMYVQLKQPANTPFEPLTEITFEIQIKTFIQHAWSIATHDLIYKTDEINWSKERIAFQIKAALEQAEVTISGVNQLIAVPEVSKDTQETQEEKRILKLYKDFFQKEDLPKDLVTLSKNTRTLLKVLNLKSTDLRNILNDETSNGRGTNLKNLSPYLLVLQSIISQKKEILEGYLNSDKPQKFKIFFPKEIDLTSLTINDAKNYITIDGGASV